MANTDRPINNMGSTLGRLYQGWLEHEWQHPAFSFVQEAFDGYLLLIHTEAPTIQQPKRYRNNPDLALKSGYLSLNEASSKLDVNRQTLMRLVRSGRLTLHNFTAGYKRMRFVKRVELEDLAERWSQLLTLEEVAADIGVSRGTVEELLGTRLLQAERGSNIEGSPHWLCSRRSVNECLARIYRCVEALPQGQGQEVAGRRARKSRHAPLLSLDAATQMLSIVGLTAGCVLEHLAEGSLRAYALNTGQSLAALAPSSEGDTTPNAEIERLAEPTDLRALRFSKADIDAYIEELRESTLWMGCLEVAAYMGVYNYSVVKAWAKLGLLPSTCMRKGEYRFHPDTVDSFRRAYFTTKQAAAFLGVGTTEIVSLQRSGRLVPVAGPGVEGLEGSWYLFLREDIERVALQS
jgi:hypothetical protein